MCRPYFADKCHRLSLQTSSNAARVKGRAKGVPDSSDSHSGDHPRATSLSVLSVTAVCSSREDLPCLDSVCCFPQNTLIVEAHKVCLTAKLVALVNLYWSSIPVLKHAFSSASRV
ncbi:hypothetical protein RRG08_028975 [Elysia crispata]|uniref:Uncharacterized protein n=1 Tax=Elysia crispata TaxID=231223 RepID=A0AAE1BFK4_9GAST|nr:hypothetical protein RRG08_028975 [Elysia crispata]